MSAPIFDRLSTQEEAITHLELTRWGPKPACPFCQNESVGRHASGDRAQSRWQCRRCGRAFSAAAGTIFSGTHTPLLVWYRVLWIMLTAEGRPNACQISRELGIRRATVWNMIQRIRFVMAFDPAQADLFRRLVGLPTGAADAPTERIPPKSKSAQLC